MAISPFEPEPIPPKIEPAETLLDKKSWHEAASLMVPEAQHNGSPLSVLLIDLDYFKDVNDLLGHAIGDEVIEAVEDIVRSNIRHKRNISYADMDIVADPEIDPSANQASRVGGDEFGVLARVDTEGARKIAERLNRSFSDYLSRPGNENLRQTGVKLAIGIAELRPGMEAAELLKEADQDLYQNKLDQLPELSEHQKRAIKDAEALLKAAGVRIRLRDYPKYERKYPGLFEA